MDFACIFIPGLAAGSTLALHAAGLEALSGGVRPFAELQPAAALIYDEPVFGLRTGLNFCCNRELEKTVFG